MRHEIPHMFVEPLFAPRRRVLDDVLKPEIGLPISTPISPVQTADAYLGECGQEDWAMQTDADKLPLLIQAKDNMERLSGDYSHAAGAQRSEVPTR